MKKEQVKAAKVAMLSYSAAMAVVGSVISVDAIAGCTGGTASTSLNCTFATGASAPWAEAWSFTGSNNVTMNVEETATGFAACSYHNDGTKSFGQTLASTMIIRDATGKTINTVSGCGA